MEARILLVDDEDALLEGLGYSLRREGYTVDTASDGVEALERARSCRPDLIILDVLLPRLDGVSVCRELRCSGFEAPVLLLTCKDEEIDKVVGLEVGADDYITKPFATREMIARVRAHLRRWQRTQSRSHPDPGRPGAAMRAEGLRLDPERRQVDIDERPVQLSHREFELLHYLMLHCERVVTREALMEKVWGYDFEGDSNVLQVAVGRLREKIEQDTAHPRYVVTVRGVGYRFEVATRPC